MNDTIQRYLKRCIEERIFPGCVVGTIIKGKQEVIAAGNLSYDPSSWKVTENTVYDTASITKAIPTSCLALKLIEEGRLALSSRLIDFVPEFEGAFRDQIRVEHLMTHTLEFDFRLSDKKALPPREIMGAILNARLRTPPGTVFCYANATSILLGLVVERASGMRLDNAAEYYFFGPLGMRSTTFFPETIDRSCIAPAEYDAWRGRVICGEVHDESAWALRPVIVAGSSGLFSTVPDLLKFLGMLLKKGCTVDGKRIFSPETVRFMSTNLLPPELGCRAAAGWELCQPEFMGKHCTASTFGKTGFTGCAVVADPSRAAGFALLTNHTFPRRREDRSLINTIRSVCADMVLGN